jgi:hypothetical protein
MFLRSARGDTGIKYYTNSKHVTFWLLDQDPCSSTRPDAQNIDINLNRQAIRTYLLFPTIHNLQLFYH